MIFCLCICAFRSGVEAAVGAPVCAEENVCLAFLGKKNMRLLNDACALYADQSVAIGNAKQGNWPGACMLSAARF